MSSSEWSKIEFQEFLNEYGNESVIENAPTILFSKKDKEHEAYNSLIAVFMIGGAFFVFLALLSFIPILFSLPLIITVIAIVAVAEIILILNYVKSNVYINPLECWVEIFKGQSDHFCFVYYPIFSGICHPNIAKDVIYKLYQDQILKTKIDITQIEVYLKLNKGEGDKSERLGYFFQYGEGKSFIDDSINRNSWKFFPAEKSQNDNFIATANWDHQYEWRNDLTLDFDKLHNYAKWVIQRWNKNVIKPLTDEYKEKINWSLRNIDSIPKLKPWKGDLEKQTYENKNAHKDLEFIDESIEKIMGDKEVEFYKDIKDKIEFFQAYFRDLSS